MVSEFAFQSINWLFLLPLVFLWLYWRKKFFMHWPQFRPAISIRFPLLNDIDLHDDIILKNKKTSNNNKIQWMFGRQNCNHSIALSFCFMLLALAQPVIYKTIDTQNISDGKSLNIILVIDTALSMSLKDYQLAGQPMSRLSMAQHLLTSLTKETTNNKMALVMLSNPPALWLPLTDDKMVLINAINRSSTLLGGRISDMGATLNYIAEQFNHDQDKIIVLLSDGGTQVGDMSPQEAAKQLKQKGFKLYIMAMGATGNKAQAYDNSSLIYEPANLKRLKLVIDESNGQLFRATNENDYRLLLPLLSKSIKKSETDILEQKLVIVLYPIAVLIAMLLLFYAFFIQTCQSKITNHSINNSKGVIGES